MVAYNLMLAVFPFALLVLFVFGQVLRIGGVETGVLADLQRLFPNVEQEHPDRRPRPDRGQLGHDRDRRLLGSIWIGASFWGAMDTAFCRIYHVECRGWWEQKRFSLAMLVVVLALHRGQRLAADRRGRARLQHRRLPFGLSDIKALDTILLLGAALVVTFAICCVIYWAVPKGHMPWRRSGPGRCSSPIAPASPTGLPPLPRERLRPFAASARRSASS